MIKNLRDYLPADDDALFENVYIVMNTWKIFDVTCFNMKVVIKRHRLFNSLSLHSIKGWILYICYVIKVCLSFVTKID